MSARPVLIVVLAALACGGDAPPAPLACAAAPDTLTIARQYAAELGVDLDAMQCAPSGLHWLDLEPGEGEPAANGMLVLTRYSGFLPEGRLFDSNAASTEVFPVVLGEGGVIRGWEEGLVGMRRGGKRRLVIPPHIGYGSTGAGGVIPPDATLVFDVEVVDVLPAGQAPGTGSSE